MARRLQPTDAHVFMTELVRLATGQESMEVVDTSTFTSAGEMVWNTGVENVYNKMNILMGKIYFAARKYSADLTLMDSISTDEYTHRFAKVSYYALDAIASGNFNTDLYTNLADGFTNGQNKDGNGDAQSTKSQWEQNQRPFAVFNYGGSSVWDFCVTLYEDQVQQAFRNEAEFNAFIENYMIEHGNDLESQREAWNRMTLLNKIGQTYDMSSVMPGSVKNLTKLFNDKFGTNYTSQQLRTVYLKNFLEFFVAEMKADIEYLKERSAAYHWSVPITYRSKTHRILRHTPYSEAHVYLFNRLYKDAESMVLPEIFNDDLLRLENYQPITFWQCNETDADRPKVKVTPSIIDTDTTHTGTYGTQIKGDEVSLDYVVGLISDRDGLMTDFQIESARTTPVEARKGYRNTWLHFAKNSICDPTEKTILYIMKDETPPTPTPTVTTPNLLHGNVTFQNGDTIKLGD